MSSLSNSIERLKKYSEQQDLEAKQKLLEEITKQEQSLKKQLTADMQNFRDDLDRQKQVIQKDLIRLYKWPFWIIIGVGVVLILGLIYLTREATLQYNDMQEWKQSAALYKENSQNIKLSKCDISDQTTRLCVQIDPKYNDQTWGGNYKVLTVKAD